MKDKIKDCVVGVLLVLALVLLDQWTKHLAVVYLKDQDPIAIIKGVFELHYLENRGAAFGILQGKRWVFFVCTAVVLALIAYFYVKMPRGRRFMPLKLTSVLIAAGAVGNLIDRMLHAYVVDFLYFKLIDFPVFNVADCYVTVGAVLLGVLIIFVYKEGEFEAFTRKKNV